MASALLGGACKKEIYASSPLRVVTGCARVCQLLARPAYFVLSPHAAITDFGFPKLISEENVLRSGALPVSS